MMPSLPLPTVLHPLAVGTVVSALGNGAWYASWALFLTRVLELSLAEAGTRSRSPASRGSRPRRRSAASPTGSARAR